MSLVWRGSRIVIPCTATTIKKKKEYQENITRVDRAYIGSGANRKTVIEKITVKTDLHDQYYDRRLIDRRPPRRKTVGNRLRPVSRLIIVIHAGCHNARHSISDDIIIVTIDICRNIGKYPNNRLVFEIRYSRRFVSSRSDSFCG